MKKFFIAIALALATTMSVAAAELPSLDEYGFPDDWDKSGETSCTNTGGDRLKVSEYSRASVDHGRIFLDQIYLIEKNDKRVAQIIYGGRLGHIATDVLNGDELSSFRGRHPKDAAEAAKMDSAMSQTLGMTQKEFRSCH